MNEFQKAIEKTKKYAGKYGQKLDNKQLFLRLISPKIYSFEKIKGKELKASKHKEEWQKKFLLAKKFVENNLAKMKGIKMVGITGSVAAEAAKKNEDIDLLIVTKENELWWWRLYLRFYIWWRQIPHRRFGEKEKRNEFCFNLWLDMANLEIPLRKRNLKNATDLIMMKVLWDSDGCYQEFLEKNKWVEKYLATGYGEIVKISREVDKKINSKKKEKKYLFKKIINQILFWGQYFYMWSKKGQKLTNIEEGRAFFHEK